jgi:hypothetical protein
MRITNRAVPASSSTPVVNQGISVSNRGKGPRKAASCRSNSRSAPTTAVQKRESTASPALGATPEDSVLARSPNTVQAEAERVGNSVQGIGMAVSRKVKRKLPMVSKKPEDTQVFDGEINTEDLKTYDTPWDSSLPTQEESGVSEST